MPRRSRLLGTLVAIALLGWAAACASPGPGSGSGSEIGEWELALTPVPSSTSALLQAISPVDDRVVWVSGHEGVWGRSLDGGESWFVERGPGGDSLQFRDVHGFDQRTAVLLSAGSGAASRIYRTDDGGSSWRLTYLMPAAEGFLDCLAFWDDDRGVAYGDAVEGALWVLRTEDGGRSWTRVPAERLPAALPGEGGFAASGTCVVTGEGGRAWIATGNGTRPRLLTSDDFGRSWRASALPLAEGAAAGATSIDVRPDGEALAVGGVIGGGASDRRVARTTGEAWEPGGSLGFEGPAYGVAWIRGVGAPVAVAVGPGGLAWTRDGGRAWEVVDTTTWWAVAFAGPDAGWASGPGGKLARLRVVR